MRLTKLSVKIFKKINEIYKCRKIRNQKMHSQEIKINLKKWMKSKHTVQ